MKFVIDECLFIELRDLLLRAGHEAEHVIDLGLRGSPDTDIMEAALNRDAVLLTADTDFGELHSRGGGTKPSVVIFRREIFTAEEQASLVLGHLEQIAESLAAGAIVIFDDYHPRLRLLPIQRQKTKP